MKKLNKLQINPNRLMKNEELVSLRGGYGEGGGYLEVKCGFCDNYTSVCFGVYYHNWDYFAQYVSEMCGGTGATYGPTCPPTC